MINLGKSLDFIYILRYNNMDYVCIAIPAAVYRLIVSALGKKGGYAVMKENRRYEHEIERFCKFCEKASALTTPDTMLCKKHGIVDAGGCCRRFVYDPLKREPVTAPKLPPVELIEL